MVASLRALGAILSGGLRMDHRVTLPRAATTLRVPALPNAGNPSLSRSVQRFNLGVPRFHKGVAVNYVGG